MLVVEVIQISLMRFNIVGEHNKNNEIVKLSLYIYL